MVSKVIENIQKYHAFTIPCLKPHDQKNIIYNQEVLSRLKNTSYINYLQEIVIYLIYDVSLLSTRREEKEVFQQYREGTLKDVKISMTEKL